MIETIIVWAFAVLVVIFLVWTVFVVLALIDKRGR